MFVFFAEMLRNCGNAVRKRAPDNATRHLPGRLHRCMLGSLSSIRNCSIVEAICITMQCTKHDEGRGLGALIRQKQTDIVRKGAKPAHPKAEDHALAS